jgi:hypothetical protein
MTLKIKPLEWTEEEPEWWGARAIGFTYEVRQARASVRIRWPRQPNFEVFDGDIEAAKRAAQADFEAAVLSVLETS